MIVTTTLSYDDARRAVEAAVAELSRRGKAAVVAVADSHGDLIAFARMDSAPLSSIAIAINKAWTAVRTGAPTADLFFKAKTDPGFDIAYYGDPRCCGWGGGVPLRKDGQVIGSIAVSALTMEEDAEIASLAASAVTQA
jgi:glc operon protein GlcG